MRERPYWSNAAFVTVLRDPVTRVWSMYTYIRRKSIDFQTRSLLVMIGKLCGCEAQSLDSVQGVYVWRGV